MSSKSMISPTMSLSRMSKDPTHRTKEVAAIVVLNLWTGSIDTIFLRNIYAVVSIRVYWRSFAATPAFSDSLAAAEYF